MPLVPGRFLLRLAYPCRHRKNMPRLQGDRLLDLEEDCRIDNLAAIDAERNFADFRLAWNELGLGVQFEVRGKDNPPQGDAARPRGSDGCTLWLDMRDARAGHRASRYCHQFHLLPTGGGPDHDEPVIVQTKINRALEDAPLGNLGSAPIRLHSHKAGYLVEAFLPATVLHGFDPEQHPRLGFFYSVRDEELGEQFLSVGQDFPFWDDPSLWSVLELIP